MPLVRRIADVLWLIAAVFVAAVILTRTAFLWADHRQILDRGGEAVAGLALVVEEYARRVFETANLLAEDVARAVQEAGGPAGSLSPRGAHELLVDRVRKSPSNDYLMVVDSAGVPFALSDRYPAPPTSLGDRAWFRAHSEAGEEAHVGSALFSRITSEMLFTFSRRIEGPAARFDGVVQVAMRPGFLDSAARASDLGGLVRLSILGAEDGRVVAETGLAPERTGAPSPLWPQIAAAAGEAGLLRVRDPETGADRLLAFRRLSEWPVVATASVPVGDVLAPWYRTAIASTLLLLVLLAPVVWLTWFGLRLARQEEAVQRELVNSNRELAAALADRDVLLREVHHRVKNNLQVTNSLLLMQSLRFEDQAVRDAFQETQERLQSIALVHETLYRRDMSANVDLSEYLERLVDGLARSHGARERGIAVRTDVEPVALGLDRAVPLALCLTEAITNAFKHGFPQGAARPGAAQEVSVAARREGADLVVEVRDTGAGDASADPPAAPDGSSLGMTLMRVLSQQLGGSFELVKEGGMLFRLRVPLSD